MATRIQRPNSAPPSNNETPGPPPDLGGQVDGARNAVLSILKDTDWPKEASNDVEDLIRKIEAPIVLDELTKEGTAIPEELNTEIHQLLGHLASAQTRLKGESEKYGPKKKGFRKGVKTFFSRNDPIQCKEVVRACRADIVGSWTTLSDLLDTLEAGNEQRLSRATGDESNKPLGARATQPASMSNPNFNAPNDLTATSVSSNSPHYQSPPHGTQVASTKAGEQNRRWTKGEWLNSANKAFKLAEGASGALPVVGSYLGAVAKVGLTVVEMVQTMEGNDETAEKLGNHVWRLSNVLERVREHSQGSEKARTIDGMNELQQELHSVQQQLKELQAQRGMKKVWSSNDNAGSLKNLQEQLRAALEEIQLLANLKVSILVSELHNEIAQIEHRRLLNQLGDGRYGAQGNLVENRTCLPGTRVEILQRIDDWIRGASGSERVLWIRGMAGRGKSTIASTVAHNWKRRAACAIFHFRRGQNNLDNRLICSLARQLGRSVDPELRNAILSSVGENDDIAHQHLDEQFNALFVTPLSTFRPGSFPVLIIVDALDECDSAEYAVDFIKLIKLKSVSLPHNVKFLLTSRPEYSLVRALEPMRWREESLDAGIEIDADVERFLLHGLARIKEDYCIEEEWPSPPTVSELVRMSQGLFQWARTVIKYISERSPTTRLTNILTAPESWSGVDELYTQILYKALENVDANPSNSNLLLGILGTLIAAPYPVSLDVVAFLNIDHEAVRGSSTQDVISVLRDEILADLNSLLLIPKSVAEPIRLMHTSVRDLLVDRRRCRERSYWVDLAQNHRRLAAVCVRQMNRHLRENICGLSDLSKPCSESRDIVEREVSRGLQYCCRSWSIHLTESGSGLESDGVYPGLQEPDFEVLSEEKILYWLEVMSLIGYLNEVVMMAKQGQQWLSQHVDESSRLNSLVILWNDVQRFAAAFAEPIGFNPLHIYVSALAHCPLNTELWKRYSSHAKVRTIRGVQSQTWSSDVWTRTVGGKVFSVAFSPDGALLASGCGDGTIHLLNPYTGGDMCAPLTGHTELVPSLCFSSDGKLLASGSRDGTIRVWDPQTGSRVGEPLTGHDNAVCWVGSSPDGKLLASGSFDHTIRLLDPQNGSQVGEPLTGHRGTVRCLCSSPDGKLLASGSDDDTIRLWDPQTRSQVGEPLTGHRFAVSSVCFSPDGKLLASECGGGGIRLWDTRTRSLVGEPLTRHWFPVSSVCFSPDGKRLAHESGDGSIRLLDPRTCSQVGAPLTGHSGSVKAVCFSPDGRFLASGSYDGTIRLWDTQAGSPVRAPHQYFWDLLESTAGVLESAWKGARFSPHSKQVGRHSELADWPEKRIRSTWNPFQTLSSALSRSSTTKTPDALIGPGSWIKSACFSPDGKLLASGYHDGTIRLWDPQTGSQVGEPLTGHSGSVNDVCFSPDGKLLASGSDDNTIRLWDLQTGSQAGRPLTGHRRPPRSHRLEFRTMPVAMACKPRVPSGEFRSAWFSADGKSIAGCDDLERSMAWDVVTRQNCDVPSPIPPATTVNYKDHWVNLSSAPLFWLPSQYWSVYRDPIVILCEGKLVVADYRRLSIFDISDALSLYNHLHL